MKNIIIDESILVKDPRVIFKKKDDIKIILPRAILRDLKLISEKSDHTKQLLNLIDDSVKKEILSIGDLVPESTIRKFNLENLAQAMNLSWLPFTSDEHKTIVSLAKQSASLGEETYVATEDKKLVSDCKVYEIETLDTDKLNNLLGLEVSLDAETQRRTQRFFWSQVRDLIVKVGTGIVLSVVGNVFISYINPIVTTINVWGTLALLLTLGIGFYWIRSKFRLVYGVAEFFIGFVTGARVFFPAFNYQALNRWDILQILGGVYIMVRGLDNFGKGLKDTHTRLANWWINQFGDQ